MPGPVLRAPPLFRNLVEGERNDVWGVDTDQDYHEELRLDEVGATEVDGAAGDLIQVPQL